MMFAKYQYVLKSYEDDDNKRITTENKDAEKFRHDLTRKKSSDVLDEEISVYRIADNSNYVKIKKLSSLKKNEVYISTSFAGRVMDAPFWRYGLAG